MPSILEAVGSLLSGGASTLIKTVFDELRLSPEQRAQIELAMAQHRADLEKIYAEHDSQIIEAINTTMQAESKSEHWLQWSWRPIVGYTFSLVIINNFILLPYFSKFGLQVINLPQDLWMSMLVVLGVAAGTRGLEKYQQAKNDGNGNGGKK